MPDDFKSLAAKITQLERKMSRGPRPHVTQPLAHRYLERAADSINPEDMGNMTLGLVYDKDADKYYISGRVNGVIKKVEIT